MIDEQLLFLDINVWLHEIGSKLDLKLWFQVMNSSLSHLPLSVSPATAAIVAIHHAPQSTTHNPTEL
jgi:hypothetical protein